MGIASQVSYQFYIETGPISHPLAPSHLHDNEAGYVGLYDVLVWWHGGAHTQDVMDQRWT